MVISNLTLMGEKKRDNFSHFHPNSISGTICDDILETM